MLSEARGLGEGIHKRAERKGYYRMQGEEKDKDSKCER